MKMKLLAMLLISTASSLSFLLAQQDQTAAPLDYQKLASSTEWRWEEQMATPLFGIAQAGPDYDITISSSRSPQRRGNLAFGIFRDGKEVYAWKGHDRTVFRIVKDRLYYAFFLRSASGGQIVAVDLTSGKELWKSPLTALGTFDHSAYASQMTLDAGPEAVFVFGNESMGRYFEIKDADTGATVGHRRYSSP